MTPEKRMTEETELNVAHDPDKVTGNLSSTSQ
jgi:hypothetical protein